MAAKCKYQEEQADESSISGTRTYFDRCVAIVRPALGRVIVSAIFVVTIPALELKYTAEESSWVYSLVQAAMIAIGIGLAVLSTAVMEDEKRKR